VPADHEVYAYAPLALVTAQVSLSYEPGLNDAAALDTFAQHIRTHLPVLAKESTAQFAVMFGPGEVPPPQIEHSQPQVRATNEARTVSVTLNQTALTVEATEYVHFDGFAAVLGQCLEALEATVTTIRVTRAGLRYVDEVRPPGLAATGQWRGWVDDALLAPLGLLPECTPVGVNGVVGFQVGEQSNIVFRWGEQQGSTVISPFAAVRRPTPPEGRFMVLDADAFWQPTPPQIVTTSQLLDRFTVLHAPLSGVFEASLTDQARGLFRGETTDD
jgi:uncharacterized protein (TIGR04255 family)